jgi:MFS family permease
MMSNLDLRDTERKTYLSYFDDGIADILAGLPVFSFGLGMIFDSSLFFILTGLPIIFFGPLKKRITLPRMGYVKFSPERQRRISRNMVLLLAAGLIFLLLGIVAFLGVQGQVFNFRDFMMEYGLLVFGAVMASAFALIAVLFEVGRFFGYGALIFGAWLLAYVLGIEPGVPVASAGAAIALIGLGFLIRFLSNYPLPSEQ